MNDDGKILLSIPAVEIKMFAISRKLKGQVAYLLDPVKSNIIQVSSLNGFLSIYITCQ